MPQYAGITPGFFYTYRLITNTPPLNIMGIVNHIVLKRGERLEAHYKNLNTVTYTSPGDWKSVRMQYRQGPHNNQAKRGGTFYFLCPSLCSHQ